METEAAEALLASPHLKRLTGLDLRGNALENRAMRALASAPLMRQLKWLNLSNNYALGLTAARALASAPAPALGFLGVSSTNVGLVGLCDVLNSATLAVLTTLHAAHIGRYGVSGVSAAELARTPVLPRLTGLDLGGFAGSGGLSILLRSPALARLGSLGLSECQIGDEGMRVADRLPSPRRPNRCSTWGTTLSATMEQGRWQTRRT